MQTHENKRISYTIEQVDNGFVVRAGYIGEEISRYQVICDVSELATTIISIKERLKPSPLNTRLGTAQPTYPIQDYDLPNYKAPRVVSDKPSDTE